ncbi:hypothetical protein ACHAXN_001919 [Cyclotella atomus]|jgi:hypothetical protein
MKSYRIFSRNAKYAAAVFLIGLVTIFHDIKLDNLDQSYDVDDDYMSSDKYISTTDERGVLDDDLSPRSRCQIVYLLGVEGTMHHGVEPIIATLAASQTDPETGTAFAVHSKSKDLRYGLFAPTGSRLGFDSPPAMDDPKFVKKVISSICPNDGRKHIVIEAASFPCGGKFRVSRGNGSRVWREMTPEAIANSEMALEHPTNLYKFYDAYSKYAEVKFLALHRPFLETIASHRTWDSGPIPHSNIIQGFLILHKRFLDVHKTDPITGDNVWTVIHVEKLSTKYHGLWHNRKERKQALEARKDMIRNVATFLGWPKVTCKQCFESWRDSTTDYSQVFEPELLKILTEHKESLSGIWPPDEAQTIV